MEESTTCAVGSCERAAAARALCQKHYFRLRRGYTYEEVLAGELKKKPKTCGFLGCEKKVFGYGLCNGHYIQRSQGKELTPFRQPIELCSIDGCGKAHQSKGYCGTHYSRWRKGLDLTTPVRGRTPGPFECSVDGCGKLLTKHSARGLCGVHYARWLRLGTTKLPTARKCETCHADGCVTPVGNRGAKGLCPKHYKELKREESTRVTNEPCPIAECAHNAAASGLCQHHQRNLDKYGDALGWAATAPQCRFCDRPTWRKDRNTCGSQQCSALNRAYEAAKRKAAERGKVAPEPAEWLVSRPDCAYCGKKTSAHNRRVCRDPHCQELNAAGDRVCCLCGGPFISKSFRKFCTPCRSAQTEADNLAKGRVCNWDGCTHGVRLDGYCTEHYETNRRMYESTASPRAPWIAHSVRLEIYERDSYTCHICQRQVTPYPLADNLGRSPSLDHIVPRSQGGTDDPDNLAMCCRSCNSRRQDKDLSEAKERIAAQDLALLKATGLLPQSADVDDLLSVAAQDLDNARRNHLVEAT